MILIGGLCAQHMSVFTGFTFPPGSGVRKQALSGGSQSQFALLALPGRKYKCQKRLERLVCESLLCNLK